MLTGENIEEIRARFMSRSSNREEFKAKAESDIYDLLIYVAGLESQIDSRKIAISKMSIGTGVTKEVIAQLAKAGEIEITRRGNRRYCRQGDFDIIVAHRRGRGPDRKPRKKRNDK